jgi:hypothetical protein
MPRCLLAMEIILVTDWYPAGVVDEPMKSSSETNQLRISVATMTQLSVLFVSCKYFARL